jgi:hypothetical protein
VSAVMASPAASGSAGVARLIRSVPCSMRFIGRPRPVPGRRFHALHDKILRRDVLWRVGHGAQ